MPMELSLRPRSAWRKARFTPEHRRFVARRLDLAPPEGTVQAAPRQETNVLTPVLMLTIQTAPHLVARLLRRGGRPVKMSGPTGLGAGLTENAS